MLYLESACKMDLKRGQFPVVSAYSNGDGCSDGEQPQGNSQAIIVALTVEKHFICQ